MTVDNIIIKLQWWSYQIRVKENHQREKILKQNIKLIEKLNNIKRNSGNKCVNWELKILSQKVIINFYLESDKSNTLPNSFPFKAQILQHFKNQIPVEVSAFTQKLVPAEWGLVALENRSVYLPKDKDHLTKKYITNFDKIWDYANVVIEVIDARNI